ncbi:MAG: serine/threonine protein kinase [Bradymonadia bacterium]
MSSAPSFHSAYGRLCPRCRRPAAGGRRCPYDGAFYVERQALEAVGRDSHLGALVGDRYVVEARLGFGGMGSVYRGRDEESGEAVAVKFLREEYASHPAIRQRFIREAEAGASLVHPNVVSLLDFGVDSSHTLYIVMDLVEGHTLRDEVNKSGAFSVAHARDLAVQILRGLQAAHDVGLVHRDLKHDNIMLVGDRSRLQVRLLDFGVVKINGRPNDETLGLVTQTGVLVGSPSYMSPEQVRGLEVGPPADVYALAVVLYEAMTARRLFKVDSYDSLLREGAQREAPPLTHTAEGEAVPPAFNRIIQRALAHDPAERFPDARTMRLALEQMDPRPPGLPTELLADAPATPLPTPVPAGSFLEPTPLPDVHHAIHDTMPSTRALTRTLLENAKAAQEAQTAVRTGAQSQAPDAQSDPDASIMKALSTDASPIALDGTPTRVNAEPSSLEGDPPASEDQSPQNAVMSSRPALTPQPSPAGEEALHVPRSGGAVWMAAGGALAAFGLVKLGALLFGG